MKSAEGCHFIAVTVGSFIWLIRQEVMLV